MEDENTGPLEATIHNLQKEIARKGKEGQQMQRHWIKNQTELVAMVNEANVQSEKVMELHSQETILDQKRLRLDSMHTQQMSEIKQLQRSMQNLHHEMSRLNGLISTNKDMQHSLVNQNYNMEHDFVVKLQDKEQESIRFEANIISIKEEKARILEDIVEAERQIMQWEKKIELERETQATLDPETGDNEREGMKKEIHRMELRLKQLKRKQEELIGNMEQAIHKRESIAQKGRVPSKSTGVSQAAIRKAIATLKKNIKKTSQDGATYTKNIKWLEQTQRQRNEETDEVQQEIARLHEIVEDTQKEITKMQFLRKQNSDDVSRYQRMVKRYNAVAEGKYKLSGSEDSIEREIERQHRKRETVHDIMENLCTEFPHLNDELELLLKL
eukprot:GFYU01004715.1.p1 GENE.GFYU01004715.1~~GFYU01004715.1.p1  ORF type:complete len:407 (+),score=177.88 GFYU01004715.1:64-1221(+)